MSTAFELYLELDRNFSGLDSSVKNDMIACELTDEGGDVGEWCVLMTFGCNRCRVYLVGSY
jgi:hypothetical protein